MEEEYDLNGDYRKLRRLGSGGDGTVFLVCHLPTEQLRAAKVLKTENPVGKIRELNLMKRLHYPTLPQIIDVLEENGRVWIIMEFISGRTLTEIGREEMTGEMFFSVARQLAETLVFLHFRKQPVLHLDIKPSNVLLQKDGRLVLIDFGAAVFSQPDGQEEARFGTRGFAAPEQQRADARVDARADIYGFGATMYYCLYGIVPPGSSKERESCKAAWKKGWQRRAGKLCRRCMHEEPEKRFRDSKELYRTVCRMENRCRAEAQLGKVAGAAAFLAAVTAFTVGSMVRSEPVDQKTKQADRYWRLLEMAEGLGFSQAVVCYGEAAAIDPSDSTWCLQLLGRIVADYTFTVEEEETLKKLIFMPVSDSGMTAIEAMGQYTKRYGELAYQLGRAYWYYYEGEGGKAAAVRWFEAAIAAQAEAGPTEAGVTGVEQAEAGQAGAGSTEAGVTGAEQAEAGQAEAGLTEAGVIGTEQVQQAPEWLELAKIYVDIGRYYEKLGKRDENGQQQADYAVYWKDLVRLWNLDSLDYEAAAIKRQIADELLSCLIMGAFDLKQAGETLEEIQETLAELEKFVLGSDGGDQKMETEAGTGQTELERYAAAAAAVERVYVIGRSEEVVEKETE